MSRLSLRVALAVGLVAIIAIGVTMGLNLAGSPAEARKRRLDDRRLDDLRQIQAATDLYWSRNGRLPGDIKTLEPAGTGQVPVKDPVRDVEYGYRVLENDRYELCADFERDGGTGRWAHTSGHICFTLESEKADKR